MQSNSKAYKAIGIAGGGQLARMMSPAAKKLGFQVFILDPDSACASASVADHLIIGDFSSAGALSDLGKMSDVITFEIEKVSCNLLREIEAKGKLVRPSSRVLSKIQDKLVQKLELVRLGLPVSSFDELNDRQDLAKRLPCVWKARRAGYDGKGVAILRDYSEIEKIPKSPGYTEELVAMDYELAILIARAPGGQIAIYPTAEIIMDEEKNVMNTVVVPAAAPQHVQMECRRIASILVESFDYVGLMAVEFFVDKQGRLLVNEISPRPHNSGHYTIEACETSQFEQHIRAITGCELGSASLISPAATFNVLGEPGSSGEPVLQGAEALRGIGGVYLHDYGKATVRPGRKMGHVTVIGNTREDVLEKTRQIQRLVRVEGSR